MTEALSSNKKNNSINELNTSYEAETDIKKIERKKSINSSNPESSFNNLNSEIKSIIENETDLSFSSNSNSDIEENKTNIEHLFDSKYWRASKEIYSETDEKNSTNESQNEKRTPSKKENFLFVEKNNSTKPFLSKYAEVQDMVGVSIGSNKQSTQSNEDEDNRIDNLHNISYSPINSFENNENEESEKNGKRKGGIKIIEKEKVSENKLENNNNNNLNNNLSKNINNNINNNSKLFMNGFNNYNNIHNNLKYNNDSELLKQYEQMNYKNNTIPFFTGMYYPQQLCSFMPNYNYPILNKKNFISTNNNTNNKIEEIKISEKNDDLHSKGLNNINGQNNNLYNQSYLNNMNYTKKVDMIDLPLVYNQSNPQNNTINYRYPKININMMYCPQIQPINPFVHKPNNDKITNNTNYLPDINNRENMPSINDKKSKNNSNISSNNINNNNTSNNNNNICPKIEQNNNKQKLNSKNNVINKSPNLANSKVNSKGEKQILNLDDIVTGKDTRTTVMIRNIPIKYTDEILIEALNEFNGKYDCLYMPYDYEKNGNKGYAFINFVNPLHILYFYEKFNGTKWAHFESSKICELNCAHFQGINEIQKHAKNYKGQKKPSYYSRNEKNENMIIPSKYLLKLKKRFPKLVYNENKIKKIIIVKSFE